MSRTDAAFRAAVARGTPQEKARLYMAEALLKREGERHPRRAVMVAQQYGVGGLMAAGYDAVGAGEDDPNRAQESLAGKPERVVLKPMPEEAPDVSKDTSSTPGAVERVVIRAGTGVKEVTETGMREAGETVRTGYRELGKTARTGPGGETIQRVVQEGGETVRNVAAEAGKTGREWWQDFTTAEMVLGGLGILAGAYVLSEVIKAV